MPSLEGLISLSKAQCEPDQKPNSNFTSKRHRGLAASAETHTLNVVKTVLTVGSLLELKLCAIVSCGAGIGVNEL